MGRLIDADRLKADFIGNRYGAQAIEYVIDQQPTVDAVPVVRCKDCAYWGNKVMLKDGTRGDCLNFFGYMTTTDFFCKWGEKRNESGQNA